ncbi:MAG: glucose 1-dehydrogenase [Clostridia bacterium]|nr:glucose 1-dehydrogenase [Clostridia bacterium]
MKIIITGGASGIGLAISRKLLAAGHRVLICYHRSAAAAAAVQKEYSNAYIFQADVAQSAQLDALFSYAASVFEGGADALINNAGVSVVDCFQNVDDAAFDRLMAVNFAAVYKASARAVPYMLRQKSGNIINIASIWGVRGAATEALYSASKAAVIALTEALASELGRSGIRVNCIAPGVIDTAMNSELSAEDMEQLRRDTPLQRIGSGEDIAKAVSFLLSDDAAFITGQTLVVDGGFLHG